MKIERLMIEVTRRCSCNCLHCMRGDEQDIDIDLRKVKKFVKKINVSSIIELGFTGGEPFLAVNKMMEILNFLKSKNIEISTFFIATSASFKVEAKHLEFLTELYSYCSEKEFCSLVLSDNMYTKDKMSEDTIKKLSAFNFTSVRSNDKDFEARLIDAFMEKPGYNINESLLLLGSAVENYDEISNYSEIKHSYHNPSREIVVIKEYEIENVYITAKGDILTDCDYYYGDEENFKVCNIDEIKDFKSFKKMEKVKCIE